jgi:hypothetical protein
MVLMSAGKCLCMSMQHLHVAAASLPTKYLAGNFPTIAENFGHLIYWNAI